MISMKFNIIVEENETYLRNINLVGKVGDRSIYISWYSEQYSLLYIYITYQRLLRFLAHKYKYGKKGSKKKSNFPKKHVRFATHDVIFGENSRSILEQSFDEKLEQTNRQTTIVI